MFFFLLSKFIIVIIKDRGTVKTIRICNRKKGQHFGADFSFARGDFVSFLSMKFQFKRMFFLISLRAQMLCFYLSFSLTSALLFQRSKFEALFA